MAYIPLKSITDFTTELSQTAGKLAGSYQTLNEITEVDVATAPKKEVWRDGKVRLFHYENPNPIKVKTPLLVVYALVNRFDMMDLQPDRSIIRNLLSLGLDIYLIDWGYASKSEKYLTMDHYVNGFIGDSVDYIRKQHGIQKVNLLGVCQGGTLSTIYSAMNPTKVKNLITMVTPIDFETNDGLLFKWSRDLDIDAVVDGFGGVVPGQFLNFGFDMLKPMGKLRKMNSLVSMLDDSSKLMNFLRMEKWIADSPDQAGECYRQFIKDLYQKNKLIKGELEVGGKKVSLKDITMPLLNIYASEDHLVPPSASVPLNDAVASTDKKIYEFPGGHIGVFVGSRTQKELGPAITEWLGSRDA